MITVKNSYECRDKSIKVSTLKMGTTFLADWKSTCGGGQQSNLLFEIVASGKDHPTITCFNEWSGGKPGTMYQDSTTDNYFTNIRLVDIEICVKPRN